MQGVNSSTGKALSGLDHLKQSISDILQTPIGSRVIRRDYGSRLFELIDAPMNRQTILEIYTSSIEALLKWEPRFYPQKIRITDAQPGYLAITLEGFFVPDGKVILLDGIEFEKAVA